MAKIFSEVTEDLERLGFDFRINDLDDSLEVKTPSDDWRQYDDIIEDIITLEMRELGYGGKKKPGLAAMKQAISKLAHRQRYNPIKEYFLSLKGKYKPGTNGAYLIPGLAEKYFDNPDGYFGVWLAKWMTGAIAKVFEGQRNPMLVLAGSQEIGKSTFCEWLNPLSDRFVRGSISPDSKDHKLRLAVTVIWEADELGSTTRRADADALKSFLTLNEITERPPFKKYPIKKRVATSFIGTANFDGSGLLNDPTGTSRFLTCEINHIKFAYSQDIDPNDLWAEAYWFYCNVPEAWKLTDSQKAKQIEINAEYEVVSALTDVIETIFEVTRSPDDFLPTSAIKTKLIGHYRITNEQAFYNELSRVLTKMGLKKHRQSHSQGGRRGWLGIKHPDTETAQETADEIPF